MIENPQHSASGDGRGAYTLLEVMVATAIGVLLLAAVYTALDLHFRTAQAGRDVVEQATLARSLLTRIGDDITLSLGTIDPSRYRSSRNQAGSTAPTQTSGGSNSTTGSSTPSGSSGTTGSSTTGSSTTGNTSSTQSSTDSTTTTSGTSTDQGVVNFNLFVQGDATSLTVYVSRVPRELNARRDEEESADNPVYVSDLRRITYWLAGGADAPLGLARQEIKVATSEEATGTRPPDVADEASFVIADEVRSLEFSYFDGSAWQSSWDGSARGSDGKTPIGPPRAIAIVMGIAPSGRNPSDEEAPVKQYRHVIAVPVANGGVQQGTTLEP